MKGDTHYVKNAEGEIIGWCEELSYGFQACMSKKWGGRYPFAYSTDGFAHTRQKCIGLVLAAYREEKSRRNQASSSSPAASEPAVKSPDVESRRLTAPWDVIEHRECFQVRTSNGLGVAFIYFEDENPTRRFEMGRLTKDEARRIAANIAKLPELLKKES
jgi:hypothetical protein